MTERGLARNTWLDACRASAIVLVVFGHGVGYVQPLFPNMVEALKFTGFIGVELFFVLSGFLIGTILLRQAQDTSAGWLKTFYFRRMFRTFPNYAVFLGLNTLLAVLAVRPALPDQFWKYVLFVQNVWFPHPAFFPEAWSLAIEELFYAGFPLCFLTLSWALGISRRMAILVTALMVIGMSVLFRGIMAVETTSWDEGIRKIAVCRFDGLMIGVLTGWLHQAHLFGKGAARTLVALLLICSLYVSMAPLETMNTSYFAKSLLFTFTSFGCAGLLMAGIHLEFHAVVASVVSLLARISYSAYLVHMPVMALINQLSLPSQFSGLELLFLFHLMTFLLAYALYRYFEVPFYRYRDKYAPDERRASTASLSLAA